MLGHLQIYPIDFTSAPMGRKPLRQTAKEVFDLPDTEILLRGGNDENFLRVAWGFHGKTLGFHGHFHWDFIGI